LILNIHCFDFEFKINIVRKIIQLIAKTIGVTSGSATCVCWVLVIWFPLPELPLTGIAFIGALLMIMFSILAVIASVHGHGRVLILLFAASFFPIGLYLIGDPDWVRVIGILNFGYIIAGVVAWAVPPESEIPE
jgi:hypothetical protein